jgi:formate-dependent phosphoribosylglycinamide formyltransferase (GAR transformylase)
MPRFIEPVGHRASDFSEAEAWDRAQLASMSLDERLRVAEVLRRRAYGQHAPDIRESERLP